MIVIEGPDGCGKSTLCQQLKADYIIDVVLPSPRLAAQGNAERMKYETDRYLKLHSGNNRVAVDRFLFSEMAYGPVIRQGSKFTFSEYLSIVTKLMEGYNVIVFCLPNDHKFKAEESQFLIDKMPEIRKRYEDMYSDLKNLYTGIVVFNWQDPKSYDNLKRIIKTHTKENHG